MVNLQRLCFAFSVGILLLVAFAYDFRQKPHVADLEACTLAYIKADALVPYDPYVGGPYLDPDTECDPVPYHCEPFPCREEFDRQHQGQVLIMAYGHYFVEIIAGPTVQPMAWLKRKP